MTPRSTKKTVQPTADIPLRLRKRRDGSIVLTDHRGVVDAETYQAPTEHLFIYSWLMGAGSSVARVLDGTITISLANATLTYQVIEDEDEQVSVMVAQADHRGSMKALDEERSNGAAKALLAQGLLARLVDAKVTDAPSINSKED